MNAYRRSAPLVAPLKKKVEQKSRGLAESKAKAFNPALKDFDGRMQAYRNGSLSWGAYVRVLAQHTENFSPKVASFLAALELEEKLNTTQVESERTALITRLVHKLSKSETEELTVQSAIYRAGNLSHADFYTFVKNLCAKKNIDLTRYPAMDQYIRYVLLSDSLDVDAILKETADAEKNIYAALVRTDEERRLIVEARFNFLVGKLSGFCADERRVGRILSS